MTAQSTTAMQPTKGSVPVRQGAEPLTRHSSGFGVEMPGKRLAESVRSESLSEEPASSRMIKALLIGESCQGSSYLAKRLQERGCQCEFAKSCEEIRSLIRAQQFDLVLSLIRLHNDSLLPLLEWLDGPSTTLFYSQAVEEGCWWLPAIQNGERCFGSCALRSSEFMSALDETIRQVISNLTKEPNSAIKTT
jgi:hypothetical protein